MDTVRSEEETKKIINRLSRAEGQIRGIQKMISDDKDCMDVMTQLSAVRSSIDRVMGMVVANNLKDCVENPEGDPAAQSKKLEQAINMIIKK
ncbi:metal-sensitive transcriptional regulator [Companilactobacillus zhongbaensis]|uniref:metal-sensitive transcriptional regulator n=1 Tax=Companilactobacillus zhongbaensis TaxID=2486009 RepID=UPI000F76D939|nr:metal-sensitive transcriptional regulator [Companilactobacillus zhongbaensis]